MKSKLDHALALAALGFYVFPIVEGKKAPPRMEGWQRHATRDKHKLQAMWASHPNDNIGISTTKFGDREALLVVDVDNKGEKHGDQELLRLELEGWALPATFTQRTPTGGRHLVYRVPAPMRQGANVLGPGLDVRSKGGYIVAAGSDVDTGRYEANGHPVIPAPDWLVDRCGRPIERTRQAEPPPAAVDAAAATQRAIYYLEHEAALAIEGLGGDETTYKVAARLKDIGIVKDVAVTLLLEHWNERCSPPWLPKELGVKVDNAYQYGQEPPGIAAPEAVFPVVQESGLFTQSEHAVKVDKTLHPFDKLNAEFAFCIAGGGSHILWETTDHHGRPVLQHLDTGTFARKHAAWKMNLGKRDEPVTELWMQSPRRRSYDGLVFMPQLPTPQRFYNLWRGYAFPPAERYDAHPAVEAWLEHATHNVCGGDPALSRWLVGYFAHLVQRPWEKPLVALVFKGGKGVGKNALVERVGAMLGGHFLLTSNRRYLVGNFNGHLENLLMFALDEAFWSGDKQAEGQLKDLITGSHHVIEHKGKEPYTVENRTRIVVIGNEEWLVPSTHDERRFAVFDVGADRKGDRQFFQTMREGLEAGGYPLFLRFLLGYDLTGLDFNAAPQTKALLDQKHASLGLVESWWLDCLASGRIVAGDFEHAFGGQVECERFRGAFRRYAKEQGRGGYLPDERSFGKILKKVCSAISPGKMRDSGNLVNTYKLPGLKEARDCWDSFIGHKVEWVE